MSLHTLRCCGALAVLGVLATGLTSCASVDKSTPDVTRQARSDVAAKDLQDRWTSAEAQAVVDPEWWRAFGDPSLDDLIDRAVRDGIDMRLLTHRISRASEGLELARQGGIPIFSAGGSGSLSALRTEGGAGATGKSWKTGLQVSWEADIWGKVRQEKEAQSAEILATEAEWRAGYLLLIRDVAASYFRMRQFEEQANIHGISHQHATKILGLYRRQLQSALISRDVVSAQEAEILRLQREMEELDRQRALELNSLAVLVGEMPGSFSLAEGSLRDAVSLIPIDTDSITANLLERRPDVVAADLRLSKAYRIKEARRAARLPSITIGASTSISGGVGSPASFLAQFIPRISFPALDPSTKVDLKISEIDLEEARDRYTQVVLLAVQEAENGIENLRSRRRQLDLEGKREALLRSASEGVRKRLEAGYATQIEVFETERSLLAAEQLELQLYAQTLLDTVRLYNALGGGW